MLNWCIKRLQGVVCDPQGAQQPWGEARVPGAQAPRALGTLGPYGTPLDVGSIFPLTAFKIETFFLMYSFKSKDLNWYVNITYF